VALDGPLHFTVTLRDGAGTTSSIDFGALGAAPSPYPRAGYGTGLGWANEFVTQRLRLADFTTNGSGLDLGDVVAVRFELGPGLGVDQGRVALDDVELIRAVEPPPFVLAVTNQAGRFEITWPPAVGALYYNVYRGTIPPGGLSSRGSGAAAYDHGCHERADAFGDGARRTKDGTPAAPGSGLYFLVSAVRPGGDESLGQASVDLDDRTPGVQLERPNPAPCP
jgi:hypothetical protein